MRASESRGCKHCGGVFETPVGTHPEYCPHCGRDGGLYRM